MATYNALDLNSKPQHLGEFGEANVPNGKVTPTAGGNGDILRFTKIPAGSEVHAIVLANDDLDSNVTPLIAFKIGYTPVDGVNPAASDAYFVAAGDITLQAVNGGKVYSKFDPIKFEYDVFLILTLTAAAATFAAGSVWAKALTRNVGVK